MEKEYTITIKVRGRESLRGLRDMLRSLGVFTIDGKEKWNWKMINKKDAIKARTAIKSKLRYETAN